MPKCLKRKFTIGSDVSLHIRFSHIRKKTANSDAHLHYHPTPEFYLVLNGICRILLNNTIHLMQRGTVIWLAPKQIHVICEQSFDFSFIICQLKNQFLKKFENPETLPQKTAFYKLSEQELSYLEHFFSTLPPQKEAAYDIAMRYAADHLIRLFKQTTEPDQRLLHPGIEKVVRFLMQEKQKVPLKELCRLAAMSPTQENTSGFVFRNGKKTIRNKKLSTSVPWSKIKDFPPRPGKYRGKMHLALYRIFLSGFLIYFSISPVAFSLKCRIIIDVSFFGQGNEQKTERLDKQ